MGVIVQIGASKNLLPELRKRLGAAAGSFVRVGIVGAAAREKEGEITLPQLALVHEFGSPSQGIPERSFLRSTMEAHRAEYAELLRRGIVAILEGRRGPREVLELIGMKAAGDVKAKILDGVPPPNAPATLARKLAKTRPGSRGEPITLVDTGRLLSSIGHEVVVKGGVGE